MHNLGSTFGSGAVFTASPKKLTTPFAILLDRSGIIRPTTEKSLMIRAGSEGITTNLGKSTKTACFGHFKPVITL